MDNCSLIWDEPYNGDPRGDHPQAAPMIVNAEETPLFQCSICNRQLSDRPWVNDMWLNFVSTPNVVIVFSSTLPDFYLCLCVNSLLEKAFILTFLFLNSINKCYPYEDIKKGIII